MSRHLKIALVAGEDSGDALGGGLMAAIRDMHRGDVGFSGVGGEHMQVHGLRSEFPLSDVAVMGPLAILGRLPTLIRRVQQAAAAVVASSPDVVVIVDSPEFTHPIARRVRRQLPAVPIIDYVSPSVWAWRPGRAPRMRGYVDHVMAILPFEPAVHARLGGPACTYVGHPLIERHAAIGAADGVALAERLGIDAGREVLVVLPGSRRSEVQRLMPAFGATLRHVLARRPGLEIVIPTLDHIKDIVRDLARSWPVRPHLVVGEGDRHRAFRRARAALAASGTVTLELALAGTPMVVAYRVDALAARLQFLVKTPHFALANLVLGERAFPELMQDECVPDKLAAALLAILEDGDIRQAQLRALARVPQALLLPSGTPSQAAARIVLAHARMPS